MNRCKCGSYAINPHLHGRDNTDKDLCDVCFWRTRALAVADAFEQMTNDWRMGKSVTRICYGLTNDHMMALGKIPNA